MGFDPHMGKDRTTSEGGTKLESRSDAFRLIDAVQIGEAIWAVHAFQKKSKMGIKTPKQDVDLIKSRIKQLKERLL